MTSASSSTRRSSMIAITPGANGLGDARKRGLGGGKRWPGENAGVDEHRRAAADERAAPAKPDRREQAKRDWSQEVADRRPGVHARQGLRQILAGQVGQRDFAAVDEGVAGGAPDEASGDHHWQRVREAERNQRRAVADRAQGCDPAPAEVVGGDDEELAKQAAGRKRDEDGAGLGIADVEIGADRLQGASRQEGGPLVGEPHQQQRRR